MIKNYNELILKKSNETLDRLYYEQFEVYYGKDADAVNHLLELKKLKKLI